MLVLTRKAGERILIGPEIEVQIMRTGNQVRVGITAPDELRILRPELLERDTVTALAPAEASTEMEAA